MSKEKLYVIKSRSDDDFYFSGDRVIPNWSDNLVRLFRSYEVTKEIAEDNNGHVVTLIEEPEKIVLTKEQAEIVEDAHDEEFPATYISDSSDEADSGTEELLMKAYVNGYTVANEKEYVAYKVLGGKQDKDNPMEYVQACREFYHPETMFWVLTNRIIDDPGAKFTEKEISDYGLQDCEKEDVADDEQ